MFDVGAIPHGRSRLLGHLPLIVDNWSPSWPICAFHKTFRFVPSGSCERIELPIGERVPFPVWQSPSPYCGVSLQMSF
jgi:hypothetical protein